MGHLSGLVPELRLLLLLMEKYGHELLKKSFYIYAFIYFICYVYMSWEEKIYCKTFALPRETCSFAKYLGV